jgi:3-isopropylmalate/(R)-2-methylmalate dehydratase large subunit
MATQTLPQVKPRNICLEITGSLKPGVAAKDLILLVINRLGVAGGTGHALEFRGQAVNGLSMEARMTLSNMAIECGARLGLMAPDDITFRYLRGRPYAPKGPDFETAIDCWKTLATDPGYAYDKSLVLAADELTPRVTWGTNPAQNVPADSKVPSPDSFPAKDERMAAENALRYQGLKPGTYLSDISVDYAFIGSCTNGRMEDLREAAAILEGRRVKPGVTALVVPGSGLIKRQAEEEGLAEIFLSSGCQWREPGCSMCLGMNPDKVPSGRRCVSASNRNFEGRQGRGALTHLASPAVVAASAVAGRIVAPEALS